MKEYVAETGGRYTYSDDILNLQELTLSLSAIFDGCSDFIISGCEIEGRSEERRVGKECRSRWSPYH